MTVPELGRLLGLDRRQAWKLHTKVKSAFVTIRVASKPRVTKQSFEDWYQNQAEYTKVTIQSVPSSIMRKFIYKSGRTQSAQGRETCP